MPDGDYIAWHAAAKWRKLANLLKSGASDIEIEDSAATAVAKTIRASGGVPDFAAAAQQVFAAVSVDSAVVARPKASATVVDRMLSDSIQALAVRLQNSMQLVSPAQAAQLLARQMIGRIVAAGIDHDVPALVGKGHFTAGELRTVLRRMVDSTPMKELANRWLAHPTGAGLKAPNRRTAAKPLDELLGTALDEL